MFKSISKAKKGIILVVFLDIILIVFYNVGILFFPEVFPFLKEPYIIYVLIILCALFPIISSIKAIKLCEKNTRKNYVRIANTLGADISEAYDFGQIGMMTYNDEKDIIWTSEIFEERNIKLLGFNILKKFPELAVLFNEQEGSKKDEKVTIVINNNFYSVMNIPELSVLIFKDITEITDLKEHYDNDAPVVATILFDDINSIISMTHDEDYAQVENAAIKTVYDWAKDNDILLRKIKDSIYIGILKKSTFDKLKQGHFEIVRQVFDISKGKDVAYTISLGFGVGADSYSKLAELSAVAIDIAQSRGGNQTVVNNYAGKVDFFGGEGAENKHSQITQIRTYAQSFKRLLQSYETIFVVPHLEADFDAIGSCLAVKYIAENLGKKCYIVAETKQIELKARVMLDDTIDALHISMDDVLMTPKEAMSMLNDDCVVVVVDVNRTKLTTAPKLIETCKNIAVIDHHRKSEDTIDNTEFNFVESTRSSVCEMLISMVPYLECRISLPSQVATYMLAGILVDTHNFRTKVSTTTYEAAMLLKDQDALEEVANSYLKDEYEEYVLKAKVLSSMESPCFGVMVGLCPEKEIVDKATLGKISSEACDLKDVKASFVIGYISRGTVGISARSNGRFNVQLLMEKMHGGGHHSAAATQIDGITIEEAKRQLLSLLNIYLSDIEE